MLATTRQVVVRNAIPVKTKPYKALKLYGLIVIVIQLTIRATFFTNLPTIKIFVIYTFAFKASLFLFPTPLVSTR